VFELGGEALPPALAHNLMRLIAEQDAGLHTTAVGLFAKLLDRPASKKPLPSVLLTIVCWVLGEYGSLAAQLDGAQRLTLPQVGGAAATAAAAGLGHWSPVLRTLWRTASCLLL
jgi:AP-4 complex subunit epsilon-1